MIPTIMSIDYQGKYSEHMRNAMTQLSESADNIAGNMRRGTSRILDAHMTTNDANHKFSELESRADSLINEFSLVDQTLLAPRDELIKSFLSK